ncbi:MAG: amidophosphoribosyltransferase [Deltaproteobacteria bacterium]|nr:amidophosphoribosyltransferase [Deltaproteobacteria bacterium]
MCGVVGIYNHREAANLAYLCLAAEQHRGQESAGIVTAENATLHQHRAMGLVQDVFPPDVMVKLTGRNAIGHVRYSTTGSSTIENAQPFIVRGQGHWFALAHNGNLTNAAVLRKRLEEEGAIFQSTMESEVIMHLLAKQNSGSVVDRMTAALKQVEGAYSLVFLADGMLVAARDPKGFRPLIIGKLGDAFVVVSETCALDLIDAEFVREIEPGEIVLFDANGIHASKPFPLQQKKAHCIFEYIYFARPDSHIFGRDVYPIRKGFGRQLAKENPVAADVVIPVPDSGVPAALGFAEASGIPYEMGLIRSHYVGRTFIEPKNEIRHFGVKIKMNPVREVLQGKRVVVVDDSIVRGTTSKKIVHLIRKAGAKEVHVRISSPPTAWPCFYGIDTPTREELSAANMSVEETRQFIGADSLAYLSQEGLYWFEKLEKREWFCDACFTGNYPVPLTDAPHIMDLARSRKCSSPS